MNNNQKFKHILRQYNQSALILNTRYLHSGWVNAYTRRNSSRHKLLKYPAIVFFLNLLFVFHSWRNITTAEIFPRNLTKM